MAVITVRYWASARSAAGTEVDEFETSEPLSLQKVLTKAVVAHPGNLSRVIEACSVLVDERQVASEDPTTVMIQPGSQVDLLPPFAGGSS